MVVVALRVVVGCALGVVAVGFGVVAVTDLVVAVGLDVGLDPDLVVAVDFAMVVFTGLNVAVSLAVVALLGFMVVNIGPQKPDLHWPRSPFLVHIAPSAKATPFDQKPESTHWEVTEDPHLAMHGFTLDVPQKLSSVTVPNTVDR